MSTERGLGTALRVLAVGLALATPSWAMDAWWTAGSGYWDDPAHWSGGVVPDGTFGEPWDCHLSDGSAIAAIRDDVFVQSVNVDQVLRLASDAALTCTSHLDVGDTVNGRGTLYTPQITGGGWIRADGVTDELTLVAGTISCGIEAWNGGRLTVDGGAVTGPAHAFQDGTLTLLGCEAAGAEAQQDGTISMEGASVTGTVSVGTGGTLIASTGLNEVQEVNASANNAHVLVESGAILDVHGTMTVGWGASATVRGDLVFGPTGAIVNGPGDITLDGGTARGIAYLQNGAGLTGRGTVDAAYFSLADGTVVSPGGIGNDLVLTGAFDNSGLIVASEGETVLITGCTVNQGTTGAIRARGGTIVLLDSTVINGLVGNDVGGGRVLLERTTIGGTGTLRTPAGGTLTVQGGRSETTNLNVWAGDAVVAHDATLAVTNQLTTGTEGTLTIQGALDLGPDPVTLDGSGTLTLDGGTVEGTVVLDDYEIRGTGAVCTASVEISDHDDRIAAREGDVLTLTGTVTGDGTVLAEGGGRLDLVDATVLCDHVEVDAATMTANGTTFATGTPYQDPHATVVLRGHEMEDVIWGELLLQSGTVEIRDLTIENWGRLVVETGATLQVTDLWQSNCEDDGSFIVRGTVRGVPAEGDGSAHWQGDWNTVTLDGGTIAGDLEVSYITLTGTGTVGCDTLWLNEASVIARTGDTLTLSGMVLGDDSYYADPHLGTTGGQLDLVNATVAVGPEQLRVRGGTVNVYDCAFDAPDANATTAFVRGGDDPGASEDVPGLLCIRTGDTAMEEIWVAEGGTVQVAPGATLAVTELYLDSEEAACVVQGTLQGSLSASGGTANWFGEGTLALDGGLIEGGVDFGAGFSIRGSGTIHALEMHGNDTPIACEGFGEHLTVSGLIAGSGTLTAADLARLDFADARIRDWTVEVSYAEAHVARTDFADSGSVAQVRVTSPYVGAPPGGHWQSTLFVEHGTSVIEDLYVETGCGVQVAADGDLRLVGAETPGDLGGESHRIDGELYVAPGGRLGLSGCLGGNGCLVVEGTLDGRNAALCEDLALSLHGGTLTGTVSLATDVSLLDGRVEGTAPVAIEAGGTVRGHGVIGAPLANEGIVSAETPGAWVRLQDWDMTSAEGGRLWAVTADGETDGGNLAIDGIRLDNLGTVYVGPESHLLLDGCILDSTGGGLLEIDGTYELRGGAQVFGSVVTATGSAGLLGASGDAGLGTHYALGALALGGSLDVLAPTGATVLALSDLGIAADGVLRCETGTTVRLRGDFANASAQATACDMADTAFVVLRAPGTPDWCTLEVAGRDFGASATGWVDNMAIGRLVLGEGTTPGQVLLADAFDNVPGDEAVYVDELVFAAVGSSVAPTGRALYYRNGGDPKRLFRGDADLNGAVDTADYFALAGSWFQDDCLWYAGDFTGDGRVDTADYFELAAHWFASTPIGASGGSRTPEPATLLLVAAGAALGLRVRRH